MQELLTAVENIIKKHNLSDRQFCLSIGIDPSFMCHLRKGLKPGTKFLSGLMNKYPESYDAVIKFMQQK